VLHGIDILFVTDTNRAHALCSMRSCDWDFGCRSNSREMGILATHGHIHRLCLWPSGVLGSSLLSPYSERESKLMKTTAWKELSSIIGFDQLNTSDNLSRVDNTRTKVALSVVAKVQTISFSNENFKYFSVTSFNSYLYYLVDCFLHSGQNHSPSGTSLSPTHLVWYEFSQPSQISRSP